MRTLFFVLCFITACKQKTEPKQDTASGAPPPEARIFYANRCAGCHGESGSGDGPMAPMLNPKPRDLANHVWQEMTDDASLIKIIHEGGGAVGRSLSMPASPDLKNNKKLTAEIIQLIRSFKRQPR